MRLEHPYTDLTGGRWLRGNLHAHTTKSDGAFEQQFVIDDYAAKGYDFLMLSDHDIYTSPEDHARLNARGMVLIPGNEITRNGPHILHVNANTLIEPSSDRQKVMREAVAAGGIVIVAHPNWFARFDHCRQEWLDQWTGYSGIEIFNGIVDWLDGSAYATDRWDMLLTAGRRVWGYAHDDSHGTIPFEFCDRGVGWDVVYSKDRSVGAIVDALARGRFYASTGVKISGISVNGSRIRIEAENADRIVAYRNTGRRFAHADGKSIEVAVPADSTYVRFECHGSGEKRAWTQPFFVVND